MKSKIFMFVLGIMSFSSIITVAASPVPPDGVSEIIEQMGEFEESFESQNWKEAEETIQKIDTELTEVFSQSKLTDSHLSSLLDDLQKSISIKNEKLTETNFILFQNQYYSFLTNFNFEIHPLLSTIKQYIVDEASEALNNKDYDDVVSEMREAANLMGQARTLLLEKGIPESEITQLRSKIILTIMAGRAEDADRIRGLLEEIEVKFLSILERYKMASS